MKTYIIFSKIKDAFRILVLTDKDNLTLQTSCLKVSAVLRIIL